MKTTSFKNDIAYMAVMLALVSFMAAPGYASIEFSFSGSQAGGTGSGTMEFVGNGTTSLTVNIENTSPLLLDNNDPMSVNASGITGFGFDAQGLTPPSITSWDLTAWDIDHIAQITIGGSGTSTGDWVMTAGSEGIILDFLPTTNMGAKGALYNPLQNDGLGGIPTYETLAVLTVEFGDIFNLDAHAATTGPGSVDASPYMRFQNVGNSGGASMKLPGTIPPGGGGGIIPEPVSLVIWGLLGTLGVATQFRRNRVR